MSLKKLTFITNLVNDTPINELLKNSAALQFTNESWMHLQPTYAIYSFYETRAVLIGPKITLVRAFLLFGYRTHSMPLLTFVKAVTREEATLNMNQERVFALEASHIEMVKPSDRESATYTLVLQCLRQVVMHLRKIRPPVVPRPPVAPVPIPPAG